MYNKRLSFHLVGIGGSGMSGIAEILLSLGFKVSGSDAKRSSVCDRLANLGAEIFYGHRAGNIPEDASLLVYSSAITADNPEIVEANKRSIPVIRRAEVLAELMRLKYSVAVAGSHGKTTTTSMTASILEAGAKDPTVIIGGRVKSLESGGKVGRGEFLVAETDESDRSFLLLKPTIAVITNIDSEHLTAYASLAELEASFEQFLKAVPFYGLAILCIDDRKVRELASRYSGRKITYGVSPDAQLCAVDIRHKLGVSHFTVVREGHRLFDVELPLPGRHMVVNCLAAIAVGLELDVPIEQIQAGLRSFSGVERRLEVVGRANGIMIMNDYGHHPTEIKATLRAVREGWGQSGGKIHVAFQPHRYTRTRDCFVEFIDAFHDCDSLVLTDIYAASEVPLDGISGEKLFEAVVHRSKEYVPDLKDIPRAIASRAKAGDIIICLGAGSIGQVPEKLAEVLNQREKKVVAL